MLLEQKRRRKKVQARQKAGNPGKRKPVARSSSPSPLPTAPVVVVVVVVAKLKRPRGPGREEKIASFLFFSPPLFSLTLFSGVDQVESLVCIAYAVALVSRS